MTRGLKRGLFGFRGAGVEDALEEREQTIGRLADEAKASETRAADLEAVLEATRGELATARSDLEELDRKVSAAEERSGGLETELERSKAEALEHGDRARRVELEVTGLQMEIAAVRGDLLDREARIRELEADLGAARSAEPAQDATGVAQSPSAAADLNQVLLETERAITHLLSEARSASDRELAEAERRRGELRADVERLTAWRDEMAPLAQEVCSLIALAQRRTTELDEQLRSVLDPMTASIGSLNGRLAALMERASEAPLAPAEAPNAWRANTPAVEQVDEEVEVDQTEEVEHPTPW